MAAEKIAKSGVKRKMQDEKTDRFQFQHASKQVAPGLGAGEHVSNSDDYAELAKYRNFRQVLSNFYVTDKPLPYDGKTFRSVEHIYHYMKFKSMETKEGDGAADKFTIESGTVMSKGLGADAQKQRKMIIMNAKQRDHWDVLIPKMLQTAWRIKFLQDPYCRKVLAATGKAELWHVVRFNKQHWTDDFYQLDGIRREAQSVV